MSGSSLGGAGERLPQPLPAAPSVSSPTGQVEANSPRHPAVGASRSPEQRPSRACPTAVGGGDPPVGASLTANGDNAAAHTPTLESNAPAAQLAESTTGASTEKG